MQFNRENMMKRTAIALLLCRAVQLQATEWLTDLPQALNKAKAENKLVLMDFTGSDWCPGCIELHKAVFDTKTFEDYANKHFVLVEVDFPDKLKQPKALEKANLALKDEFKVDGFPTVILVDADRKQLKMIDGYSGETPDKYIADLAVKGQ
jgi:thioredoxin-related protein